MGRDPVDGQAEYVYDAFVSYGAEDAEWVFDWLIARLESRGLNVCTDRDFAVGVPTLTNLENAAGNSRYLVPVLTVAWAGDHLAEFTQLLFASSDGPIRERTRPVLREPCSLPLRIDLLTCADLTGRHFDLETELGRLVESLRGYHRIPPAPPRHVQQDLVGGIEMLVDAVRQEPAVRIEAMKFRVAFRTAYKRIGTLGDLKELHDLLHEIQIRCYNPLNDQVTRAPRRAVRPEDSWWDEIAGYDAELAGSVGWLRSFCERTTLDAADVEPLRDLIGVQRELHDAVRNGDFQRLRGISRTLQRIIGQQPARINGALEGAARDLPLEDLIEAIGGIRDTFRSVQIEESHGGELDRGREALVRLKTGLDRLIDIHKRWQTVEDSLQMLDRQLDRETLDAYWPPVRQAVFELTGESEDPLVGQLRESCSRFDQAVDGSDRGQVRRSFTALRHLEIRRFYNVDRELLNLCGELRDLNEPLADLLEGIDRVER
jgi:hypothetical protein